MTLLRVILVISLLLLWMSASISAQTPTVTTGAASDVAATNAQLIAASITTGNSAAVLAFDYGTTTSYGSQVLDATALNANGSYTSTGVFLEGFTPGTNGMLNVEVHDTTDMSAVVRRFMRLQVIR